MCKTWGSFRKGPSALEMGQSSRGGRGLACWPCGCASLEASPCLLCIRVCKSDSGSNLKGPGSSHPELWRPHGQVPPLFCPLAQGSAPRSRQEPGLERGKGKEGKAAQTYLWPLLSSPHLAQPQACPRLPVSQTRQLDRDLCAALRKPLSSIFTGTTITYPPGSTNHTPQHHTSTPQASYSPSSYWAKMPFCNQPVEPTLLSTTSAQNCLRNTTLPPHTHNCLRVPHNFPKIPTRPTCTPHVPDPVAR